jgi:putative Holliday junction resolvase
MRILAIDYGTKRLGLSISDEQEILASPLTVRKRSDLTHDISFLIKVASDNKVGKIVIGLPLNMDGSQGEMAKAVQSFASKLRKKCCLPVVFFDERMSTKEAERVLVQADLSRKRRKNLRDSVAAVLILQGYLDFQRSMIDKNKETT